METRQCDHLAGPVVTSPCRSNCLGKQINAMIGVEFTTVSKVGHELASYSKLGVKLNDEPRTIFAQT